MSRIACLLFSVFLFSGCGLQQREEELKKKEAELNQKEQQLLLREKTLQLKEEELAEKQMKYDTLARDSSLLAHPNIPGTWSTKMTCEETTCTGSAVGDTKIEQWIISFESGHIVAKAMADDKLTRVYIGTLNGNAIELNQASQDSSAKQTTMITVRLTIKDEKTLEGKREIVRNNDCRIVYALEMNKQND